MTSPENNIQEEIKENQDDSFEIDENDLIRMYESNFKKLKQFIIHKQI